MRTPHKQGRRGNKQCGVNNHIVRSPGRALKRCRLYGIPFNATQQLRSARLNRYQLRRLSSALDPFPEVSP